MTIYDFLSFSLLPLHLPSRDFGRSLSIVFSSLWPHLLHFVAFPFSPYNLGYPLLSRPPPLVLHQLRTMSCMLFPTCYIEHVGY